MKVLAFRHVPFEGLGRIAEVLAARGIESHYADLYLPGGAIPNPDEFDGLIFMGGPMSVNDPFPWLAMEMDLIRRAAVVGQPVLGICLGAQLIARALGAAVHSNPAKEIGWFPLSFTTAAASDPLLAGLDYETVFHWHGETFDLPSGAELLASSELCRHQAFRAGESLYGLQFHLEVTPEMIADWCLQDENCGDVRELPAPVDPVYNAARLQQLSAVVFGRWCDMLSVEGSVRGGAANSRV